MIVTSAFGHLDFFCLGCHSRHLSPVSYVALMIASPCLALTEFNMNLDIVFSLSFQLSIIFHCTLLLHRTGLSANVHYKSIIFAWNISLLIEYTEI